MIMMGTVEYKGQTYGYADKDENGYFIPSLGWISAKSCGEVEEESLFTPQNEFEKAVTNICMELAETLIKKNRDYGDSFKLIYDEYGDHSTEIRLTDKLNRFKTLNKKKNLVKDESKEDTLFDIMGYSCLTLATKGYKGYGQN